MLDSSALLLAQIYIVRLMNWAIFSTEKLRIFSQNNGIRFKGILIFEGNPSYNGNSSVFGANI